MNCHTNISAKSASGISVSFAPWYFGMTSYSNSISLVSKGLSLDDFFLPFHPCSKKCYNETRWKRKGYVKEGEKHGQCLKRVTNFFLSLPLSASQEI